MKLIFGDESRICIAQGDETGTFFRCHANEIYNHDCLVKTKKSPSHL